MIGTMLGVLFVCLIGTVPIAVSLGLSCVATFALGGGGNMIQMLAQSMVTSMDSFSLMAIPFFMLVGSLMEYGGIAKKLVDVAEMMTGNMPGGLGMAAIVASMFFAAISGSGPATAAAIGGIMIGAMVSQGYSKGYSGALIAAGSTIGPVIPPSIPMIMYGVTIGVSVSYMFIAGIIPGILMGVALMIYNYFTSKKRGYKGRETQAKTAAEKAKVLKDAIPAILMPIIILGGIYGGVFTPTEAAAVAAIYSVPIGLWVYKAMKVKDIKKMLFDSINSVGAIMVMIIFCLMLSQTLTMLQVPQALIQIIFGLTRNKTVILIILNLFLFVVGMIVNDSTGMLLCAPLLLPLVKELGVSPVHFAAIMGVNLAMGGVTPPYASILYLGMRIGNCEFKDIFGPTMKLLIFGYVPVVFLTTFWPELSMFLPRLFGYV